MSSPDEQNKSKSEAEEDEKFPGLDFYPERRGDKISRNWLRGIFFGENRDNLDRMKCERRVQKMATQSPLVKLLMDALKSSGCDFDLNRHVSCEPCSNVVSGGYDPELNQIVVCHNVARSDGAVHSAMSHEMIHMFDFCRADVDFSKLDHVVCAEIRAANLVHCSFMGALVIGSVSPFHISKQHRECVKQKALSSVMAVRDIRIEDAEASFNKVFSKCYNDLEPLGRRIKRGATDMHRAYRERYHYGYV